MSDWFRDRAGEFGGPLLFGEPLARHAYYRIGGPARVFAQPRSRTDLEWLRAGLRATGIPFFILGAGSNVLVSDAGFDGLVIRLNRLDTSIEAEGGQLRTGTSVAVSSLLRRAGAEGWGGLEFLAGVPGSIGGVVAMNAGTHLGEARDRLESVETFALIGDAPEPARVYTRAEMSFDYRRNLFLPAGALVVAANWRIDLTEATRVRAILDDMLARRKATQPVEYPSCGSVFKNPRAHGKSAWQVVDALGLRGHRIGDAQVSEKHPNFIVNLGGARAVDVRALIELVKARARADMGIAMEEEVKFVGDFP